MTTTAEQLEIYQALYTVLDTVLNVLEEYPDLEKNELDNSTRTINAAKTSLSATDAYPVFHQAIERVVVLLQEEKNKEELTED